MNTRKYKVAWLQNRKRIVLSFFRPESALEFSIIVLKLGHPLLFVEQ